MAEFVKGSKLNRELVHFLGYRADETHSLGGPQDDDEFAAIESPSSRTAADPFNGESGRCQGLNRTKLSVAGAVFPFA